MGIWDDDIFSTGTKECNCYHSSHFGWFWSDVIIAKNTSENAREWEPGVLAGQREKLSARNVE